MVLIFVYFMLFYFDFINKNSVFFISMFLNKRTVDFLLVSVPNTEIYRKQKF